MNDKLKPGKHDEQPVSGAKDERVHAGDARNRWQKGQSAYPGGGVNGPVEEDKRGYKTHYGETTYGGGQKRYDGQPPVEDLSKGDDVRPEGKAGSKATLPGAGADHGPPDQS